MPEEIEKIEDLKKEGITLKEGDTMWPEPSQEQMALWQEIEKNITEKILKRESLFGSLSKDIKTFLASEYTSNKLIEISQKYNLKPDQAMALSHYIKNLFITFREEEELEIPKLINLLRLDLDIEPEKSRAIFQAISNQILLPALKNIITESVSEKSTKPENNNPNVVDLKNQ